MIKSLEEKARELANGLGIPLYIRGNQIWQKGPGKEIRPDERAKPRPHGIEPLADKPP